MSMPLAVAAIVVDMINAYKDVPEYDDYYVAKQILTAYGSYHGYTLNENDMAVILRMVLDGRVVPAAATVGELTD